jgi:hypothetical protein
MCANCEKFHPAGNGLAFSLAARIRGMEPNPYEAPREEPTAKGIDFSRPPYPGLLGVLLAAVAVALCQWLFHPFRFLP